MPQTRKKPKRRKQPNLLASLPRNITLTAQVADLELTAAEASTEGQKPKVRGFSMTAYTGGQMRVEGYYYPVVVDLQGMTVRSQTRPILYSHDHKQIVGHSERIDVTTQTVKVGGKISGISAAAGEVTALGDNGFPWQSSIGAQVEQLEFVDRGNTVKVNGRNFPGPVYVARKTSLREISFAALGADDNTTASIAATSPPHQEPSSMNFSQWLKAKGFDESTLSEPQLATLKAAYQSEIEADDGDDDDSSNPTSPGSPAATIDASAIQKQTRDILASESDRISKIRSICARYDVTKLKYEGKEIENLEAHAIREGWSADQTELAALRASRPSGPAIHTAPDLQANALVIECAVAKAGKVIDREKFYKPETLEAADRQFKSGIGLQQLLIMAAAASGYVVAPGPIRQVRKDFLRAAFSMSEISGILSNIGNKQLLASFNAVESVWRSIAATRPVNDFKTVTSYRLIDDAKFERVGPDGKLAHAQLSEESFTNKAETHGKILSLTRQDIINDDLGALTGRSASIGRGAALQLNEVFWKEFLNNAAFFTTGRKNYFEGAATNLQFSSLQTAEQMFLDQTDPKGNPLGLMPATLLTASSNSVTARELFQSTNIVTGSTGKNMATNVFAGKYRPEVSAYVGNTALGGSQTAWYLLANSADLAVIEVVFLNGQETPIIEEAEAEFDTLGVAMRGYFDFGVAKRDWRAGVKSKGAA